MVGRHDPLKVEGIEVLPLAGLVTPHYRLLPSMITLKRRNHASQKASTELCNQIGHNVALRWMARAKIVESGAMHDS